MSDDIDMRAVDAAVDALWAEHAPPPADPLRRLWEAASGAAPGAAVELPADLVRAAVGELQRHRAAVADALRYQEAGMYGELLRVLREVTR